MCIMKTNNLHKVSVAASCVHKHPHTPASCDRLAGQEEKMFWNKSKEFSVSEPRDIADGFSNFQWKLTKLKWNQTMTEYLT